MTKPAISLVIPLKNESQTLIELYESIEAQTFKPDEIILVDGGSTDQTTAIAENLITRNPKVKLIKTHQAYPGKGRNIGVENASNKWVAFTDAGIRLEKNWLENLAKKAAEVPDADIIYGNYSPVTETFFEKCAAISFVPSSKPDRIRGKFIASCLLRKSVWEKVGGFPNLRAAEDNIFMDEVERLDFKTVYEPNAQVFWQLSPDVPSMFQKFVLYSKFNVWANRMWEWHYGILKQYLLLIPFILLAIFQSPWWLLGVVLWLVARTIKRILPHLNEFGWSTLFNPVYFGFIAFLMIIIDIATFIGWAQALLHKNKLT